MIRGEFRWLEKRVKLNNATKLIEKLNMSARDYTDWEMTFSSTEYHRSGGFDRYEEGFISSDVDDVPLSYNHCPQCGEEIYLLNNAGNDFCKDCTLSEYGTK